MTVRTLTLSHIFTAGSEAAGQRLLVPCGARMHVQEAPHRDVVHTSGVEVEQGEGG